jgi:hypothetical protein
MYILLLNIKNNMAGKCRDILWRVLDGVAHIHQKRRIIIDASAEEKSQWGWVGNIRFLVGKSLLGRLNGFVSGHFYIMERSGKN